MNSKIIFFHVMECGYNWRFKKIERNFRVVSKRNWISNNWTKSMSENEVHQYGWRPAPLLAGMQDWATNSRFFYQTFVAPPQRSTTSKRKLKMINSIQKVGLRLLPMNVEMLMFLKYNFYSIYDTTELPTTPEGSSLLTQNFTTLIQRKSN